MAGPIHYEVYIRKTVPAPWSLFLATEDRAQAVETAEDMLKGDGGAVAVRVTKETLNPATMEFDSVSILTRGAPEPVRKRAPDRERGALCSAPVELYTAHARETIGRVLDDWLRRNDVTPFELLHRPDLVEKLEASGVELQHAIQKVAVPESQSSGQSVHELMRHYQKLTGQAVQRVIEAGRAKAFPRLADRSLADVAHRMYGASDRGFLMAGMICADLALASGAREKLERLLELAGRAPGQGPARALCLIPIEQILCELLSARSGLAAVLGPSLDQGTLLAAAVRLAAPSEIAALIQSDPRLALQAPTLTGPALDLGQRLEAGEFPLVASTLARLVHRELLASRRLRPHDAAGEIEILRLLAMTLTATAGRLLTMDEVQAAFAERSRTLVTADFVTAFLKDCETPLDEVQALVHLCENVTGPAAKRQAAQWLEASVSSLKFEMDARSNRLGPAQTLAALAALQQSTRKVGLAERDEALVCSTLGKIGGQVEAEAALSANIARSRAPEVQKLSALLRMAAGVTCPLGPAAERARAEALKLLKAPELRAAIAAPDSDTEAFRSLIRAAGLAA